MKRLSRLPGTFCRPRHRAGRSLLSRSWWGACLLAGVAAPAGAAVMDLGDSDFKFRWDNTLKYSNAFRMKDRDPTLTSDINLDDGDRNFGKGLISNRLDLLSEADLSYGNLGLRLSGAAWYDSVYNRSNDNNSAGLFGPGSSSVNSTGAYNQFLPSTRDRHGRMAEVLTPSCSARPMWPART